MIERNEEAFLRSSSVRQDPGRAPEHSTSRELFESAFTRLCERMEQGEDFELSELCREFPDLEESLIKELQDNDALGNEASALLNCLESLWPHAGDSFLGFTMADELGRGAFGRVFQAEETQLGGRRVAVKVCHAGAHEAWIMGRLKHENIVPVHSLTHDPVSRLSAICMPYLGRATLHDLLRDAWNGENKPSRAEVLLPVDDDETSRHSEDRKRPARIMRSGSYVEGVLHIGAMIADALAYAHDKGILHLDVKPSNILVDECGCARLLDFNLSAEQSNGIPKVGGTLPYMSPEQARCFLEQRDVSDLDERSDVFSLGVVMAEMLCGRHPFDEAPVRISSNEVVERLLTCQRGRHKALVTQYGEVDASVCELVNRCMAVNPKDRYRTAAELADALRNQLSFRSRSLRRIRTHGRLVHATVVGSLLLVSAVTAGLAFRAPYPTRQYRAGVACFASGEYEEAVTRFTSSLVDSSRRFESLLGRAEALVKLERHDEAIRDLVSAGTLTVDARQKTLLAFCFNHVGLHSEAIGLYLEGMKLGQLSTSILNNLGRCYDLQGQDREALEYLNEAVARGDHTLTTRRNLAEAWRSIASSEKRSPTEAMREYDILVHMADCPGTVLYLAASTYADATAYDESLRATTHELIERALDRGIPMSRFENSHTLAPFFEEIQRKETWKKSGVFPRFLFFLHPLE